MEAAETGPPADRDIYSAYAPSLGRAFQLRYAPWHESVSTVSYVLKEMPPIDETVQSEVLLMINVVPSHPNFGVVESVLERFMDSKTVNDDLSELLDELARS